MIFTVEDASFVSSYCDSAGVLGGNFWKWNSAQIDQE